MSTLLVSLLTGVGYDAYVISGYAAKHVTQLDQSHTHAEELKELIPTHFVPKPKVVETKVERFPNQKYHVKQPKTLKSSFLLKQEDRLKHLQQQQEKRAKEADQVPEVPPAEDPLKGLRVHSWVLVLPGKREVSEAFFIESTTGAIFDTQCEVYLGLESVWSPSNYWVNMQICYDGLKGISFDLADNMKWEFVLLENTSPNARKGEEAEDDEDDKENITEIVDVPPSWVDKLQITQEQFESKCPSGGKATQFKNGKSEVFAEYHRNDGMVKRVSFNENDKMFANMTAETFANRKDKLFQRVRIGKIIHEFYHPGRSHGLKEHIMSDGVTKQMEFYSSARPDGLIRRLDEVGKVIYHFEDREDNLVYKSITYEVIHGEV